MTARAWYMRVPAAAVLLGLAGPVCAETFERAPTFEAARIKGIKRAGENFAIRNPVRSDGLYRIYAVATSYGGVTVAGDHMMRMRINEFAALAALEKVSESDHFAQALLNAGLNPLKYAGKLVVDPLRTLHDTFAGVGSFLDGVSAGVTNGGKSQEDMAASLIGVTRERRLLAAKVGVDPYTDFEPLAMKLAQMSEAAALGGLAVTGAMFVIPGTAGIVVSNLSTANKFGDMRIDEIARSFSATQIYEMNRQRLVAMGIDPALADSFLTNRRYTPIDQAAIVASLDSMRAIRDRGLFVRRAALANSRAQAYIMRKQAELTAAQRLDGRFVMLGGVPVVATGGGGLVAALPADAVSWTEGTAKTFGDSLAVKDKAGAGGNAELRITGQVTPLARERLEALGWRVVENSRL